MNFFYGLIVGVLIAALTAVKLLLEEFGRDDF